MMNIKIIAVFVLITAAFSTLSYASCVLSRKLNGLRYAKVQQTITEHTQDAKF